MAANAPQEMQVDGLHLRIFPTNEALGAAAAAAAAEIIRQAVDRQGCANLILATGNSQLTFLAALRQAANIPWSRVNLFHMDEYVGLDAQHPAGFSPFLHRHLVSHISPQAFFPVPGRAPDLPAACRNYEALLRTHPADLCALGIGENGHLAFNDPPFADFDDPVWVKVVTLAEASRRQQVGEGHFGSLDEVPTQAITLTLPALLAARKILAIVPEARKAEAVRRALRGPIHPACPASILRRAPQAQLYLDRDSAALLSP